MGPTTNLLEGFDSFPGCEAFCCKVYLHGHSMGFCVLPQNVVELGGPAQSEQLYSTFATASCARDIDQKVYVTTRLVLRQMQ